METKIEIWKRKIRNGKRKQAEMVARKKATEQEEIWQRLSTVNNHTKKRKLKASWKVNISNDLTSLNFDAINEITDALADEILKNRINEVLRK